MRLATGRDIRALERSNQYRVLESIFTPLATQSMSCGVKVGYRVTGRLHKLIRLLFSRLDETIHLGVIRSLVYDYTKWIRSHSHPVTGQDYSKSWKHKKPHGWKRGSVRCVSSGGVELDHRVQGLQRWLGRIEHASAFSVVHKSVQDVKTLARIVCRGSGR
jgi:hypothetical protein